MPLRNERFSYVVMRKATLEQQRHHPPSQRVWTDGRDPSTPRVVTGLPVTAATTAASIVPDIDDATLLSNEDVWLLPPADAGARDSFATDGVSRGGIGGGAVDFSAFADGAGGEGGATDKALAARLAQWRDTNDSLEGKINAAGGLGGRDDGDSDWDGANLLSDSDDEAELFTSGGTGSDEPLSDSDGGLDPVDRSLADAAWVAAAQGMPGAGQWARIVRCGHRWCGRAWCDGSGLVTAVSWLCRKPLLAGGHVILDVCTPEGTFERRIPSR